MEEIQNIIDAGAIKLEKMRQEKQARETAEIAAKIVEHRKFYAEIRESLADILPPAVLKYCSIEYENDEQRGIDHHLMCTIDAPGCSPVQFRIHVFFPISNIEFETFQISKVSYVEPGIFDNEIYEGDLGFSWKYCRTTNDIEIAMAMAAVEMQKFHQCGTDRINKSKTLEEERRRTESISDRIDRQIFNPIWMFLRRGG